MSSRDTGLLKIRVEDADLTPCKASDWFGEIDPYVKIVSGGKKYKTKNGVGKRPSWGQEFSFNVDLDQILEITVKEYDALSVNETIGSYRLSIRSIMDQQDTSREFRLQIDNNGIYQGVLRITASVQADPHRVHQQGKVILGPQGLPVFLDTGNKTEEDTRPLNPGTLPSVWRRPKNMLGPYAY